MKPNKTFKFWSQASTFLNKDCFSILLNSKKKKIIPHSTALFIEKCLGLSRDLDSKAKM